MTVHAQIGRVKHRGIREALNSLTHEDLGGGVVDANGLEDGSPVVGHLHLAFPAVVAHQDLVLQAEIFSEVSTAFRPVC